MADLFTLPLPWRTAIEGYCTWLLSGNRSRETIQLRRRWLIRLAQAYPDRRPWTLRTRELADFLAQPNWQPETRRAAQNSVRGLYRWGCEVEGLIRGNPAARLPAIRIPRPLPRPTTDALLEAAVAVGPVEPGTGAVQHRAARRR